MRVADRRRALKAIKGLTFADCVGFFGEATNRELRIAQLARQLLNREGELEVDDRAVVSEGDDNGAYVMAWVYLDFSGLAGLDKETVGEPGPSGYLPT